MTAQLEVTTEMPDTGPSTQRSLVPGWALVPVVLLVVGFFFVPYMQITLISFRAETPGEPFGGALGLSNYTELITDSFTWTVMWRTVLLALITTVVCLILGYPLAYQMARSTGRVRAVLTALVLAPLLLGVIVRSYGWIVILSDNGPVNDVLESIGVGRRRLLNSEAAVIVGMVHIYLPFMVLSLSASLQSIHVNLEQAARSLGARPLGVFRRVIWPLSRPGVAAGCAVVFVLSSSAFVIPTLLGGFNVLTIPILVVQLVRTRVNWPVGSALSAIHFLVTIAVLAAGAIAIRGRARRGEAKDATPAPLGGGVS